MNMIIYRAQNEQHGWGEDELGYPVSKMPTKSDNGYLQICDYYAECNNNIIPIAVERKSLPDFYGSTIPEKSRARLYSEIERYHNDSRFDEFIIIVEATKKMYMAYFPPNMWALRKSKMERKKFIVMINKKKATVIKHLEERGARVIFAQSRLVAAQLCGRIFRESIKKGYDKILEIQ